jgi:hypothetical protein
MYVFMLAAVIFTALGFAMAYLIARSILNQPVDIYSTSSMAVFGLIALATVFVSGGLNAALAKAYHSAYWKEKTSMTSFFKYALKMAPEAFGILLIRELVWLVLAGPMIAIYIYFLSDFTYTDALTGIYVLFVTFIIHMAFTPAFIAAGAFGTDLMSSLKHAMVFLRRKHFYFIVIYAIFALAWLLGFIPLIGLISLLFLYPAMYSALIVMIEDTIKIEVSEE